MSSLTRARTPEVIVVGAGPTGLTLGCELARRGVSVRVFERRTERERLSKAIGVHARTLEVLDAFGLAKPAVALGRQVHAANVYSDGERVAHVTLDRLATRFPFVLILPQYETERLLEEHLASLGVTVERGVEVTRVRPLEHHVEVDFDVGAERGVTSAGWVVGCDGAHSVVRTAIGVPFTGTGYEERFALADLRIDWELPDDEVHAFLSASGLIAVFPLPEPGFARVAADVTTLPDEAPSAAMFTELLAERGGVTATLSDTQWATDFRIHKRLADTFMRGRCLLAGDAAHIHSPAGGQGMNTGIQDAANLGWKLAAVVRGRSHTSTLLESYESERKPVARATLRATDFATRVGMWRSPMSRAVRGRVASLLSSLDAVQDRLTRTVAELDVNYRRSPIVAESVAPVISTHGITTVADRIVFARGPHPGDRAPDVVVGDGSSRLHDWLRGTEAVLLVFATGPGDARDASLVCHAVAGGYPGVITPVVVYSDPLTRDVLRWDGLTIVDSSESVSRAYGAAMGSMFLVRPDGYVAFRSDSLDPRPVVAFVESVLGRDAATASASATRRA